MMSKYFNLKLTSKTVFLIFKRGFDKDNKYYNLYT